MVKNKKKASSGLSAEFGAILDSRKQFLEFQFYEKQKWARKNKVFTCGV